MTLSSTTLCIMSFSKMTLGIKIYDITIKIITLSLTTLCIMSICQMTLSIITDGITIKV